MIETGYIYALINPMNDQIFYIGKTKNKVKYRVRCHIHGNGFFGTCNKNKMKIINEIIANKLEVQYKILKEIKSDNLDSLLDHAERVAIKKYRHTITNLQL